MNHTSSPSAQPRIDPAAIHSFCDVVFGYLEGLVPVRLLAEKCTPAQAPEIHFPATNDVQESLTKIAAQAARTQRGVFVVPGTVVRAGSAKARDIVQTGVLLVDLDGGDIPAKLEHLTRHLGPPSLVVASGGITSDGQEKLHVYWRLTEAATGEDLALVGRLRGNLAAKIGGDSAFRSLHQPIRVAGTIHGKNGQQAEVQLMAHRPVEYELAELAEAIDAMPALPGLTANLGAGRLPNKGPRARALAVTRVREGGVDGITRFDALTCVIGHWIRTARRGICTLEEAWQAVVDHNQAKIVPPWDEDRLRREFDALRRLDESNNGPVHVDATEGAEAGTGAAQAPALSDDALAAAFVARHGRDWRHVPVWGAWYRWTGQAWERDETGLVRELVRQVCRSAARQAETPNERRRVASDKTIAAALRVAASDPAVAARTAEWDGHPMLLNTPSGVIDLETGEVLPHDPALLLSQITTASAGQGCPLWLAFLDEITGGDRELQAYLQRLAGYCLTGSTREQVFVFLHGHGANGKSVFLQTLAGVIGSYAATATTDTFMASGAGRHLTELAGLRAARLVLVPEIESGSRWAEARIKMVTGGEAIRANFMHRDHFEFTPQFKLIVAGNHRPSLSNVGEAMRRRLNLVPFTVTIPPDRRDQGLTGKLLEERDGILGWMLEGCAEWLRIGLAPPACVTAAATEYFASEDLVGQWIEECCVCGPEHKARSSALYRSWKGWAEEGGHQAGSAKSLGEALRALGFEDGKVRGHRGWFGLALRSAPGGEEVGP